MDMTSGQTLLIKGMIIHHIIQCWIAFRVIYYQNHNHPIFFDDYKCAYAGDNGTMIMFPSQVFHHVKEQTSSKERITLAFNIIKRDAV